MTLEEAIEILTINALEPGSYLPLDYINALKLGIEAIKREKFNRDNPDFVVVGPLPGETED